MRRVRRLGFPPSDMTESSSAFAHGADSEPRPDPVAPHAAGRGGRIAVVAAVAALGVVFGDIGTSPLYALKTVFLLDGGAVRANQEDVFGVISLMFWSITIVVSIKYVMILM